jgi:ATP-binding cassette subfamily B protein
MRGRIARLTRNEPQRVPGDLHFGHEVTDRRPYNLRRLLRPRLRAVILAFVLIVAETLLMQAGPLLTQIGIDRGIAGRDFTVVLVAAGAYVVSLLVGGLVTGFRTAWTGRLAEWLNYDQRVLVFGHLQRLSLEYFTNERAGRIMTRMTSDIEATNQLIQQGIVQLMLQGLTIIVVTAVLVSMNPFLALVTVGVVVPSLGALTWWYGAASRQAYNRVRDTIAGVISDLQETLSGMSVVIATQHQERHVRQHTRLTQSYRDANMTTAKQGAVYSGGSQLIGIAAQAVILLVGGRMVLAHQLTIGQLVAFILYLTAFFAPIQQMAQLYNVYQSGRAAIRKLAGLLAHEPSVRESAAAEILPPVEGDLAFEGVSFGYDPAEPVLVDFNLHIAPGETVALVGPTGAGKSTIAKLIPRFYDPTQGRIRIDGHDLRDIRLDSLRRQLGVVPQEPFLFAGSIRDNIAFSRPDATDGDVMEAARIVGLEGLLTRLPNGIETEVSERGASLSAGERQLLALARAVLAQPRVLVLDEATSNLDLQSEMIVERALDVVLEGRTAVIIAHRLSTAMRANRIAVIDDGHLVEIGSHAELVANRGLYASMYATWVSHLPGADIVPPLLADGVASGSQLAGRERGVLEGNRG